MPRYSYKVKDLDDRVLTGTMNGTSVDDVLDRLSEKELIPINVEELNFDGSSKGLTFMEKFSAGLKTSAKRVPYKSVVFFTRQLATMLKEGVPLARAMTQLAKGESPVFKKTILDVADDISRGYTFADAVAKQPHAFNNMFVSVSYAGEVTGALDRVLDELADYMENIMAMRMKVKSALRYPIVISVLITVIVVGMLWKLVPTFESIYTSLNANLPLPTLILIGASHILRENLPLVIAGLVLFIILFKVLMTKDNVKAVFDKYILYAPIFGNIIRKNILSNFSRTMSLLMESGTPILKAVEIGGAIVNNKHYARAIEGVYAGLKQGEMLSAALEKTGLFPVLVTQLVETGEISGKVDTLLRKAGEFYDREIRAVVDSLASILEPILIVVLGIVVGGIMIAMYMPIFMMGEFIK